MNSLITHGIEPTQLRGSEEQLRGGRERTVRRRPAPKSASVPPAVEANEELDQDPPAHELDDLA